VFQRFGARHSGRRFRREYRQSKLSLCVASHRHNHVSRCCFHRFPHSQSSLMSRSRTDCTYETPTILLS
jgi:hypothetical protein